MRVCASVCECECVKMVKLIFFSLKEHPDLVEKLQNLQVKVGNPKPSAAIRGFVGAFNELRDLTHSNLASTVEDERARNFFFAGIYIF